MLLFIHLRRTWEWERDAQIRGYAHPGLFAVLYKTLALLVSDAMAGVSIAMMLLHCAIAHCRIWILAGPLRTGHASFR